MSTSYLKPWLENRDTAEFRKVLAEASNILVLSGAGLSAASGVATFRGLGGRWHKYAALVATLSWSENQSRVWQYFHYRREDKAILKTFSKYNSQPDSELIEMHGRLFDVRCTAHDCDFHETNIGSPICPALAGTELAVVEGDIEPVVHRKDLPHCPQCGQLLRPDRVVGILELADQADLCIIVGTSTLVQSASKLGTRVQSQGGKVAVFNFEMSNHSKDADFVFLGPCETRLSEVLGI
ncbi:DHS-like NAD/FAD-binding domain-containing protein [Abortiporus biennis]|nr:DHS-like NAD/FAD-binding domain-containing protein [Abortiporus biennis]